MAFGQDPERSLADAYIIPAFRGEQTFMPTSFLEIVELPDGRIELRRAEDEGSLVTLDFSEDAKVFLQGQHVEVAKAMLSVGAGQRTLPGNFGAIRSGWRLDGQSALGAQPGRRV